jgi:hypothetical protein
MIELTYEQHAAQARARLAPLGLDCIHYAPNWSTRADALYALANASGVSWWRTLDGRPDGNPGILPDGRMVVASEIVWFVEMPY